MTEEVGQMAYFSQDDINNNNILAAVVLVPLLFWVYFITDKQSNYVRYCANQGLVFTIIFVILSVGAALLGFLPIVGWIFKIADILLAIVIIVQMIGAFCGSIKDLPLIGEIDIF